LIGCIEYVDGSGRNTLLLNSDEEIGMKRLFVVTLAAGAFAGLAACDSIPLSHQTQGAAVGAVGGAVAGSALTGGSALGTVGGAVAGGVVGSEVGKRH
jgi:osmotically inducible lipoprotein OsmB